MLDLNLQPSRRELRQFAVISLVGFAAIGCLLRWKFDLTTAATVMWVLAPVIAVLGLAIPIAVKPLYVGLIIVSYPIGWVISHLVLGLAFYGVITCIAFIFRLLGRDVLGRTFDRSATSYWVPRQPTTDMRRYFRQF